MSPKIAFAIVGDYAFFPGVLAAVNSIRRYHPDAVIYVVDNCKHSTGMKPAQKSLLRGVTLVDARELEGPGRILEAWQLKTYILEKLAGPDYDIVVGMDADCLLCAPIDDIARRAMETGKFTGGQDGHGVDYSRPEYGAYNFTKPALCSRYMSTSLCFIPVNKDTQSVLAEAAKFTNQARYGPQSEKIYEGHGDQGILNAVIYRQLGAEGIDILPNDLWSQHWRYWDTILACRDGVLINRTAKDQKQRAIHCGGTAKLWSASHSERLRAGSQNQITAYCWFLYNLFFGPCRNFEIDPHEFLPPASHHLLNDLVYFFARLPEFGNEPTLLWSQVGMPMLKRLRGDINTFMCLESSLAAYIHLAKGLPQGAKLVEVGSYEGGSIVTVALACLHKDITLYSVESFTGNEDGTVDGRALPSMATYYKNIHTNMPSARVVTVNAPSHTAAKQFADHTLDMVFIDDNHSEEAVRTSLLSWMPKLKNGGILAGDDIVFSSVRTVVFELLGAGVQQDRGIWWTRKLP